MKGDDPLDLEIKNTSMPKRGWAAPYRGRYPCGSLVHDDIWYYGTYCLGPGAIYWHGGFNWGYPNLGPMPGFQISHDLGKPWTDSPHSAQEPLFPEPAEYLGPVKMGAPHFVDFGKNMEHSPDGKAYLVAMGAELNDPQPRPCIHKVAGDEMFAPNCSCEEGMHLEMRPGELANENRAVYEEAFRSVEGKPFAHGNLSWISADQVYLARVTPSPETINDRSAYEYFGGHDASGEPVWTSEFSAIKPLLDWNNNMGCVTITYNAPLKKYLMCVTDGGNTVSKMNTYILESDNLEGEWKLIKYMKDFGEQAYFVNIPSKFISDDGLTMWMCYSANFGRNEFHFEEKPDGSKYAMSLHEIRLKTGEK